MKSADELGRLRRRRTRDRWMSSWSIIVRIGYPPGRLWRAVAALAMAGIVCSPSLAMFFATQALDLAVWMRIALALPAAALPFMWSVAWRKDSGLREAGGSGPNAA